MHSLATETDVRAMHVAVEEARLVVDLMDGRTIAVPSTKRTPTLVA